MGPLDLVRNLAIGTALSILVLAAAGAICAVALLALRLLRRGTARFWLAAGYVALTLLPITLGATLSGWRVGNLGHVLSQLENGPSVAMRAGFDQALVPLLFGLVASSGLALLAFVLLAAGRWIDATAEVAAPGALAPTTAFALVLATLAVTSCIPLAGRALAAASDGAGSLARTALIGGAVCTVLAAVAGVLLSLWSPRRAAPVVVRVLGLGSPALLGLIAATGAVTGTVWLIHSHKAAVAGVPLGGESAVEAPPPVHQPWGEPELAAPMPPPPPPPAPRATSAPEAHERAPARRSRAAEGIDSTERPAAAAPEAARVSSPMRIGGRIEEPRKLHNVNPVYPNIAKQARVQGVVVLECTISPQGRVTEVKLLRGVPLLNQAAIDAVKQWEYEPTLLNGVPVPVIMTVAVRFSLS